MHVSAENRLVWLNFEETYIFDEESPHMNLNPYNSEKWRILDWNIIFFTRKALHLATALG